VAVAAAGTDENGRGGGAVAGDGIEGEGGDVFGGGALGVRGAVGPEGDFFVGYEGVLGGGERAEGEEDGEEF
jgi:hypothetical protein